MICIKCGKDLSHVKPFKGMAKTGKNQGKPYTAIICDDPQCNHFNFLKDEPPSKSVASQNKPQPKPQTPPILVSSDPMLRINEQYKVIITQLDEIVQLINELGHWDEKES